MTSTVSPSHSAEELLFGAEHALSTRVVTAQIISASADVAILVVRSLTGPGYEAMMPVTEFYPNKKWAVGDTYQLLQLGEGARPLLSAVRVELVEHMLLGLCPEIRSGQVRVMKIARSAGFRTKIAVAATEEGLDPVASLVGRNANRVKWLTELLQGERVDIIPWHADQETYLKNALLPASASSIIIENDKATVSVPSHQMSAAVGNGGLNSSLAGELVGLQVFVVAA